MTTPLYEETVEGQESLACETFVVDTLGTILADHILETVKCARLQVHVETASLIGGELVMALCILIG